MSKTSTPVYPVHQSILTYSVVPVLPAFYFSVSSCKGKASLDSLSSSILNSEWVSEQCFMSPPTQYRLYGRRFLQVKRPNQQYQSTDEGDATKEKENNENN